MASKRELKVQLTGDAAGLSKSLGKAKKGFGGMSKSAKIAGAAVGAAFIGAGAIVAKGVSAALDFETSMREVYTLLPGISAKAMGDMEGDVKSFALEFGVLPEKIVPALYQSLSAGVPKDNVFEFLEVAQQAAKGGVTELETAVDGISSVVNAYGDDVITATQASDQMFTAVKLGKTTFEELSSSLSNVTPISSGLGISFAEVSAGLAAMTAKGVPTAVATTQLKTLFSELGKDGSKAAVAFEQFSDKSFPDFIKGGGSVEDALKLVNQSAMVSGTGIQNMFGSVEAGAAALTLFDNEKFTDAVAEMETSAGATGEAFDTMSGGLQPMIDRLKAFGSVALITIGETFIPILESAVKWVEDNWPEIQKVILGVVTPIKEWFEKAWPKIKAAVLEAVEDIVEWVVRNWPEISATFETVAGVIEGVVETIVEVLGEVADITAKAFGWLIDNKAVLIAGLSAIAVVIAGVLVSAFVSWAVAAGAAAVATLTAAAPFIAIAAAIAAVAAGLVWAYQNVDIFRTAVDAVARFLVDTVWPIFQEVFGWILDNVVPIIISIVQAYFKFYKALANKIIPIITTLFDFFTGTVLPVLEAVVSAVIDTVVPAFESISNFITDTLLPAFQSVWDTIVSVKDGVSSAVSDIAGVFTSAAETAIGALQDIIDFVGGLPGEILGFLGDMASAGLDLGSAIIGGILDGLAGLASGAAGFAGDVIAAVGDIGKNALNGVIQAINDLLPNEIGKIKVAGKTIFPGINLPDNPIPSLHSGGTFAAPVAGGVGYALLRDGEKVSPRGGRTGDGGQQVIQVLIDGRVLTEAIVADTNRHGPAQIRVAAR